MVEPTYCKWHLEKYNEKIPKIVKLIHRVKGYTSWTEEHYIHNSWTKTVVNHKIKSAIPRFKLECLKCKERIKRDKERREKYDRYAQHRTSHTDYHKE